MNKGHTLVENSEIVKQKVNKGRPEPIDTYRTWQEKQGIPIVRGFFVEDIKTVELAFWDFKGGLASFVNLDGTGDTNDGYVCEIPPGGKLKPQKHLYEELVYVAQGYGATTVWQRHGKKQTFEWQPGSMFAIPLNAWYQHFNGSSNQPARYFAVTNAPFIINLFHDLNFIFENDYEFMMRFNPGDETYFSRKGKLFGRFFMSTNFVADTHTIQLSEYEERGAGNVNMKFDIAGQVMTAHLSEFPVGTYKKAHRHGPGAHVIILSGQGYSVLWPEGREMVRVDWKPGSVVVPPMLWFHQHFNSGATPARYLAFRWNGWRYKFVRMGDSDGSSFTSVKEGGHQIEYGDEDPSIHSDFETAMTKAGATCQMYHYAHPRCSKASTNSSDPTVFMR